MNGAEGGGGGGGILNHLPLLFCKRVYNMSIFCKFQIFSNFRK